MRELGLGTAQDALSRAGVDVLLRAPGQRKRAAERRGMAATHREEAAAGFAELERDDSAAELIGRADRAMIAERQAGGL